MMAISNVTRFPQAKMLPPFDGDELLCPLDMSSIEVVARAQNGIIFPVILIQPSRQGGSREKEGKRDSSHVGHQSKDIQMRTKDSSNHWQHHDQTWLLDMFSIEVVAGAKNGMVVSLILDQSSQQDCPAEEEKEDEESLSPVRKVRRETNKSSPRPQMGVRFAPPKPQRRTRKVLDSNEEERYSKSSKSIKGVAAAPTVKPASTRPQLVRGRDRLSVRWIQESFAQLSCSIRQGLKKALSSRGCLDGDTRQLEQMAETLTPEQKLLAARACPNYWTTTATTASASHLSLDELHEWSKEYARQFLKAQSGSDVNKATSKLLQTLEFRRTYKVDEMRQAFEKTEGSPATNKGDVLAEIESDFKTGHAFVQGFDKEGRSTYIIIPRIAPKYHDSDKNLWNGSSRDMLTTWSVLWHVAELRTRLSIVF